MPFQSLVRACLALLWLGAAAGGAAAAVHIVALGDSLTAGLGLPIEDSLPAKLEAALRAKGLDVTIANAGVSGDTASDGLARLDWSVGPEADAVIVELGANDALRGLDPATTRNVLDQILARLAERKLPVLLAGMIAPLNYGPDYKKAFDAIYPDLARKYGVDLYPFILDAVAASPDLIQADGLHPTAAGVDAIAARLLPQAEALAHRAGGK